MQKKLKQDHKTEDKQYHKSQITNHRQDKRQLEVRARGARPSKHKNTNLQNTNTNPNTTLPLNTRQKSTKTQPSTREEEAAIQYV
jgi:hypothetical protein